MIHPRCTEVGRHNWDRWYLIRYGEGEEDRCPERPLYTHSCQNMGCDAVEYAWEVEAVGRVEFVDTKATDAAIAELKAKNDQ